MEATTNEIEKLEKKRTIRKPAAEVAAAQDNTQDRRFKGEQVLDGDLYKLRVANAKKNLGTEASVRFENVEHCHFFHSYDSSGREQFKSNAIGGHYHDCKLVPQGAGKVPKLEVGPAKYTIAQEAKLLAKVGGDNHTHDTVYICSEKVTIRKISAAMAMKMHDIETLGMGAIDTSMVRND